MGSYLAGRLLQFVPVLFGVSIAVFVILRVLPGDVAVLVLVGPEGKGSVTPQQLAAVRQELNLDRPLPEQYGVWLAGLARGDAGHSLRTKQPVFEEIARRAPLTIELAALSVLMAADGLEPLIERAVRAARHRSEELGRG